MSEQSDSSQDDSELKSSVSIDLTPECQQSIRSLSKRYLSLRSDLETVLDEIKNGSFIGDRIPGIGEDYIIIKLRVRNTDIRKGKSVGYRLIYQVESPTSVLLLTIYSKSDREDISVNEIKEILSNFYTCD